MFKNIEKNYLGKIYVENERARLTHRLSQIKEADGEMKEAAKIMHELQVSTILQWWGSEHFLTGTDLHLIQTKSRKFRGEIRSILIDFII